MTKKRGTSSSPRNIHRKFLGCNIAKKRNTKQFGFVMGGAGGANFHLKIKGLPFSHEDVPELYPEKLHSCNEKNRIHWRKNILVLENKDLHLSSGLYLL